MPCSEEPASSGPVGGEVANGALSLGTGEPRTEALG